MQNCSELLTSETEAIAGLIYLSKYQCLQHDTEALKGTAGVEFNSSIKERWGCERIGFFPQVDHKEA